MPIVIKPTTLLDYLKRILIAAGCDVANAEATAEGFLEADLAGHGIQGTDHISSVVEELKTGRLNGKAKPSLRRERVSSAQIDGDGGTGFMAGRLAVEVAIEKARRTGAAAVGIVHSGDIFMLGQYVRRLACSGLGAIALTNGPPRVHAPDGIDPVLGTNPIAFAVPLEDGEPVVIDFSTSATSFGHVRVAGEAKWPILPGLAIDSLGWPTTDAAAAMAGALNPLGGPKGFGLGLAVALLSGPMIGGFIGQELKAALSGSGAGPRSHLFLAFDPEAFGAATLQAERTRRYLREIKASRRRPGVDEILIPGERALRQRRRSLEHGIELPETVWTKAAAIAARLGVSPPALPREERRPGTASRAKRRRGKE